MDNSSATNFTDKMSGNLDALLRAVLESPHSSFYRDKYGAAGAARITDYNSFSKLPFLEKSELLAIPWEKRLYIPQEEITSFAVSSGTTRSGKPLLLPRTRRSQAAELPTSIDPELLKSLGVTRFMALLPPFSALTARLPKLKIPGVIVLMGDIRSPGQSAMIAHEAGARGFFSTATVIQQLADSYREYGFDPGEIKWISIGGEYVSKLKYDYLRAVFPKAHFNVRFGSSELESGRFYRCQHLEKEPEKFHIVPDSHLLEIIGPDGTLRSMGEAGEIVHTDLSALKGLPMIRYRTGDEAALERSACPCGNGLTLTMGGRMGFDTFKYSGVVINAEMVEAAVFRVSDFVKPDFRLHVHEMVTDGKPIPCLELHLVPRAAGQAVLPPPGLEDKLAGIISDSLYLSPTKSLSELVRMKIFGPLRVKLTQDFQPDSVKPRRIIPHL